MTACGGGGGSSASPSAGLVSTSATSTVNPETSYNNFKNIGLTPTTLPQGANGVRGWGDFGGTGKRMLFRAELTYNNTLPLSQATPSHFEFWIHNADGSWTDNTTVLLPQGSNGCIHPRKALVADFNGDGKPDVFVACHGYDAPPYPGETNKVVLSQPDGTYVISDASPDIGFHHGASAADLNGDGKIDVVVAVGGQAYVLLNDGTGHFIRETTPRLPAAVTGTNGAWFSVELVDVDGDGKLDLVIGGHEWLGGPPSVFLNPGNNDFTKVQPIVLPPVPNQGVVLDFTVTGSGSSRTIWLNRTAGGAGPFYTSRVIQKVAFPSLSSSVVLSQDPGNWIYWLIPAIVSGTNVIASDDGADAVTIPQ